MTVRGSLRRIDLAPCANCTNGWVKTSAERGNEGKSFLGRWSRRKLGGDRREASKDRSTRLSQLFYEVWMNLSDRALTSNEIPGRSPGPRASRPAGPHLPSLRGPARAEGP